MFLFERWWMMMVDLAGIGRGFGGILLRFDGSYVDSTAVGSSQYVLSGFHP